MSFTLENIRADITAYANANLAQNVIRGGFPEPEDVVYQNGALIPYVIARFSDMAQGGGRSFIGARGDQYYLIVDFLCVASQPIVAEQVQSQLVDVMLGYNPLSFGELNKRPGGGGYTITDESRPLVYVAPAAFRMSFNLVA